MKKSCPCQSSLQYAACCGQYHKGKAAPTAEALMRSRYSAYALQLGRYVFKTWDKSKRPSLQQLLTHDAIEWFGLKIVSTEQGKRDDDTGTVAFVATYSDKNQIIQHCETSQFKKLEGRWVYFGCIDAIDQ